MYGDYDTDGVTAHALLVSVLRALGADVTYYIPNRSRDRALCSQRCHGLYVRWGSHQSQAAGGWPQPLRESGISPGP